MEQLPPVQPQTAMLSNHSSGDDDCSDACSKWDDGAGRCVDNTCFMSLHSSTRDGQCNCTLLSQQTVTTVGLVLLFVLLGVVLLVGWRYRRQRSCCGGSRTIGLSDANESLIAATTQGYPYGGRGMDRSTLMSVDSVLSCTVCMEYPIDCILMPCAHEVACGRCAQMLRACPICRRPVDTTLRARLTGLEEGSDEGSAGTDGEKGAGDESAATPGADTPAAAEVGAKETPVAAAKDATPKERLCRKCGLRAANCLFLPCSHKVWCVECAADLPPACVVCGAGPTPPHPRARARTQPDAHSSVPLDLQLPGCLRRHHAESADVPQAPLIRISADLPRLIASLATK